MPFRESKTANVPPEGVISFEALFSLLLSTKINPPNTHALIG